MSASTYKRDVILALLGIVVFGTHVCYAAGRCHSVTTFNAGLTPAVAGVKVREPRVDRAIAADTSDVMCLQEVWYESSMRGILSASRNKYPHHFSALHSEPGVLRRKAFLAPWLRFIKVPVTNPAPCTQKEMSYLKQTVLTCSVIHRCALRLGGPMAVGECISNKCGNKLKSRKISQDCLSCAFFSFSKPDHLSECTNTESNRFNEAGLMVISKLPIKSSKYVDFFPNHKLLVRRGYLEVDIEDIGKVICTHLSAHFPKYLEFDMPKNYSYKKQQLAEVYKLTKFKYTNHILMGDLNTGPTMKTDSGEIEGVYPEHFWRLLINNRYKAPYMSSRTGNKCTYCKNNRYTSKGKNHILDHVLFRGNVFMPLATRRVMDEDGISDHYGIKADFCLTG